MANDVSAPLPQLDVTPNATVTVTLSDAGAKITQLNVHGWQEDAEPARVPDASGPFLFVPGSVDQTEAA